MDMAAAAAVALMGDRMDITVDVHAPKIILPESSTEDRGYIVLDLGTDRHTVTLTYSPSYLSFVQSASILASPLLTCHILRYRLTNKTITCKHPPLR